MAAWLYDEPFHIDHIVARKHHGQTVEQNLAFCCLDCNAHKGTNIAGIDVESGALTRLFNPRMDVWREHFRWNHSSLIGLTAVGRTTIDVLNINQPIRVRARDVLIAEGVFPA
jgi:hypothetical protein